MTTISAIIITKNEVARIEPCLKSIAWMDEIIVVDSGSEDGTVALCEKYGAKVYQYNDWQGFGIQKQRVLSHATSDWIFSIDADEVVSGDLKKSIQLAIQSHQSEAYYIRRCLIFMSKKIQHACGEERILRLVKRSQAHFDDKRVHESLHANTSAGLLEGILWHDSFESLEAMLSKMNRYTTLGAEELKGKRKKIRFYQIIFRSAWMFFKVYGLKAGFLDGVAGFVLAYYFAENTYYKYLKSWYS